MRFFFHQSSRTKGQAFITLVIFVLFFTSVVIGGLSVVGLSESRDAREILHSEKSFYASEAGIEDVWYRIKNGKQYSTTEVLSVDSAVATTTVATLGSVKNLLSTGNFLEDVRKTFISLIAGTGESFVYGVQVGRGGLEMENSSQVIGSIYSHGDIEGSNSASVTGDVFVATTHSIDDVNIGGSARAYRITNSTIAKNASSTTDISGSTISKHAYADRIINSTIGQNAYYQTSISGSTVGGSSYAGVPAPLQIPEKEFPISDAELDQWEYDAVLGGTISSPCPYQPVDGTIIGPKKINCDVIIDGTKVITVTGTLWISGNLTLKNSAQLKLASSYGGTSGVIVVDNQSNRTTSSKLSVENSARILGSGAVGSYVLVASRNNSAELGGGETAINVQNSSNAPVYYASHGLIQISNSAALKEATAYKMHIKNSATVTYETGLANLLFTSGPSGGYTIQTWAEVE